MAGGSARFYTPATTGEMARCARDGPRSVGIRVNSHRGKIASSASYPFASTCRDIGKSAMNKEQTLRLPQSSLEDGTACALAAQTCIEALLAESLACTRQTRQAWRPHWMAFEWSCVAGQWYIARTMLARCATLAPELRHCIDQYRGCLQAELQRASVFLGQAASGPARPNVLPGTRRWVSQRSLLAASEPGRPAPNRSNNPGRMTPQALSGRTNLGPFAWFYDSDDRLGPICEVFLGGNYFWVSFEMMSAIAFPPPVYLLDRVWRPVEIRLWNGIRHAGFVPARYVGSQWVDDELKLGHGTAWIWLNAWQQAGLGERQFCSELCCWPLSQLTAIRFHSPTSPRLAAGKSA